MWLKVFTLISTDSKQQPMLNIPYGPRLVTTTEMDEILGEQNKSPTNGMLHLQHNL